MPVYILHGFRWPRAGFKGIRVHIILHDLEDAAAEYIQTTTSQNALLESFQKLYPQIMKELPKDGLTFIEQYDPEDMTSEAAVSQPYAYVADKVITMAMPGEAAARPASPVKESSASSTMNITPNALGVNVEDVIAEGSGLSAAGWEAFADLRDTIAPGEKIGWWIVYNGDPERAYDDTDDDEDYDEEASDEAQEEDEEEETDITKPRTPVAGGDTVNRKPPTPESIPRKAIPLPLRVNPKGKPRTTPFEEQKSPLRETYKESLLQDSPKPPPSDKKLPPLPNQKPERSEKPGKPTQRPSTPSKSDTLKKKLFGRKSGS